MCSHRLSALLLLPFALLLVAFANTSSPSTIQAGCSTTSSLQGSSLGGDWRPTLLSLWLLAGYAALLAIPLL